MEQRAGLDMCVRMRNKASMWMSINDAIVVDIVKKLNYSC